VLDAVRFYKVEIVALYPGEAGKYRLDWKLPVAVDHADVFAGAGRPVRVACPIPGRRSLVPRARVHWAAVRRAFGRSRVLGRSSLPKIRNKDHFPCEAKQRHYVVKILHKWDDSFVRTLTKDRDGKFDRCFGHQLTTKSSQETRSGSITRESCAFARRSVTF